MIDLVRPPITPNGVGTVREEAGDAGDIRLQDWSDEYRVSDEVLRRDREEGRVGGELEEQPEGQQSA